MFTDPAFVYSMLMLSFILSIECGLTMLKRTCAAFFSFVYICITFGMPLTRLPPSHTYTHTQLYACPKSGHGFPTCCGLLLYYLILVTSLYHEHIMMR